MLTVIATGFGHVEPRLKLVNRQNVAVAAGLPPEEEAADGEYRQIKSWKREERTRLGRTGRAESLEVPTFLRNQMD